MKRILILVAVGLFLCSTANAFQGGGGESTKNSKPTSKPKPKSAPKLKVEPHKRSSTPDAQPTTTKEQPADRERQYEAIRIAGIASMALKWPGMDHKGMLVKSCYAFAVTKTFTDINGKITTASAYNVYLANYDLDAKNFATTLDKPLTADDQVRVTFSLIGEEGTKDQSPPKAGNYSAKADKYTKAESAGIVTRKGGADDRQWLDRRALTGNVTITSVSGDTITGEADLTSGDIAIKGPFTAKVLVRK